MISHEVDPHDREAWATVEPRLLVWRVRTQYDLPDPTPHWLLHE